MHLLYKEKVHDQKQLIMLQTFIINMKWTAVKVNEEGIFVEIKIRKRLHKNNFKISFFTSNCILLRNKKAGETREHYVTQFNSKKLFVPMTPLMVLNIVNQFFLNFYFSGRHAMNEDFIECLRDKHDFLM